MELMLTASEQNVLLDKIEVKLFEQRTIYLNDDITFDSVERVIKMIKYLNLLDDKADLEGDKRLPIHLHLTSGGGSAYDGWGLVDAIETSKSPIYAYVPAYAMSMALPIFLSADKRYMGKYATLLYHELRGRNDELTRQELKRVDKEYDRLQKIYDDYIINKSNVTQEVLNAHQEKVSDWYIDIEESAKWGFHTDVIE